MGQEGMGEHVHIEGPHLSTATTDALGRGQSHMKYYPKAVHWWERYMKRKLWQLFQGTGKEHKCDRENPENFYYKAIYARLNDPVDHAARATTLKDLLAKITRLHHCERIFLYNDDRDIIEQLSLYHYIREKTRHHTRIVSDIQDGTGVTHYYKHPAYLHWKLT